VCTVLQSLSFWRSNRTATAIRPIYVARKEVIVSAGTFNTPHLLLHSGIGDKEELAKVGINSLVHLPSVGKNMSDHALLVSRLFSAVEDSSAHANYRVTPTM
jgi:choline dehydrogenase-like flavoprotein